MKLKHKMALCMGLVFFLFTLALGMAVTGMQNATVKFDTFIQRDQAFLTETNTLYAQGLQMGQALRNVILAPANKQGYKNLDDAREAFRKALPRAQQLAQAGAGEAAVLAKIQAHHAEQAELQEKIVALVKQDQTAAIALLNAGETPLWRQIRGALIGLIKEKNASVEQSKAELAATTQRMLVLSLGFGAGALVIGAAVAFWLTRNLLRQLGGEPDYAASIAAAIAAGDLTAAVDVDDESNTGSLMFAMRSMQACLAQLVQQVRDGTDAITTASVEIATGNLDLSARTEAQAGSLEETAASMEELTSTVQQNGESVRHANELAVKASEVAAKGGEVVREVVGTMGSINASAKRIVDIISVIDGIAFQTNILALNAAVEAARAGEQGRGFAVVASEVRNLAQRSAAAAKEIKALIGDSVDKVAAGSKLVDIAGATMGEVVASVTRVTGIMAEISRAGQEQAAGIAQVNQAIVQMDGVTQQNAALVEQAAAAADSMQAQAQQLLAVVGTFKLAAQRSATPAAVRGPAREMAHSRLIGIGN
ncbi:methyl-accepting chemotaxis protein [Massilia sp. SM-13]|uniref:methyl-accepting chemotaxis protein n=1 Tax=Pseudoduganella rhizocola TaxID=3382643 RepID=UPI0038B5B170